MSDQTPRRKPGFFSRLFEIKPGEDPQAPPDRAQDADAEVITKPSEGNTGFFRKLFTKSPPTEPLEEAPQPPKRRIFSSWEEKRAWFRRLSDKLSQTRQTLFDNVRSAIGITGRLDEETIEEIEAVLLQSDVSIETATKILDRMKSEAKKREKEQIGAEGLLSIFKDAVRDILENAAPGFEPKPSDTDPYVVLMVGVNGVGKTTTVAKMAKRCTERGLKTMLVAGDTFRAAAVEQLEIWASRTGCEFVRGEHGTDPAALCFDAIARAKARGVQVVFIDTAGRLHSKSTLMAELGKVERVIKKQIPDAPHETLLVIDATTGQNAIQQVKIFSETVRITGLVMTKLDGTAKGGVLLSILDMFRIPITLIGVGESADDLRDFDPELFAHALFGEEETADVR